MIRLVVTGDREWTDEAYLKRILRPYVPRLEVLIEGEARGVDKLCKKVALDLGFPRERILEYPADWYPKFFHGRFFKGAGPVRNQRMIDEAKPTLALAFHPDLAKSKGTRDMVKRLKKAG